MKSTPEQTIKKTTKTPAVKGSGAAKPEKKTTDKTNKKSGIWVSESAKTIREKTSTKKIVKKALPVKTVRKIVKTVIEEGKRENQLIKSEFNPIISPNEENDWESWQTFNPGAVLLDDKTHFFYRAIGSDGISRLGYAVSNDGVKVDERLPYPIYEHNRGRHQHMSAAAFASGWGFGGAEDPRVTLVEGDDRLYMTYTACDNDLRVGLTSIKLADLLKRKWDWKTPILISPPGQTNKNWVLFPEKINGKYAILHSISPEIGISYFDDLDFESGTFIKSNFNGKVTKKSGALWECYVRGVGASPIKTPYGWLILYHALENGDSGKYKVGAMLLDLKDPEKIRFRSKNPILEPVESYENEGFKSGIVYVTGVIENEGKIMVYYGGADSYVNVAYADTEDFLQNLMKDKKTKWKTKIKTDTPKKK